MWDEQLKLPIPPVDAVANSTASEMAILIYGGLAAIVFLYGLKHWRDTKSPIVLVMMLGGLTTVLVEPFLDVIGAAWHPIHGQEMAFELMGRSIPIWVVITYLAYFGGLGSLNYLSFRKGVSTRAVWIWFCAPVMIDIVMEEIMLHWDMYYYYGQQPLILLWKFPLWWAPCNSIGEFLGVAVLAAMGTQLRGWKLLLIPIIMPIMDGVGYAAVGLPSVIAVNTMNVSPFLVQLAGVATFLLTAAVVHCVALLIANDSPLRQADGANTTIGQLFAGRAAV